MTQDKGKNIFESAINAVSNRDEKAAIEAAMKHGQELEKQVALLEQKLAAAEQRATQSAQKLTASEAQVAELQKEIAQAKTDMVAMRTNLNTSSTRASQAEMKLIAISAELQKYVSAEDAAKIAKAAEEAEKAKLITEHTLKADESLSHLALKYYGSAYEPYWRVIYEANKELIGDNPGRVRPGMVIKIPVLPDELKKK
jgi:nucleoid-associated protein YgaU